MQKRLLKYGLQGNTCRSPTMRVLHWESGINYQS